MNRKSILYEDNHILVVIKPYNVLSQGDSTKDLSMVELLKSYLKEKYQKKGNVYLGLVHRLDRPVGGLMVFAKTSKAAERLSKSFQTHEVIKKYLAVVHGKMEKEEDTWEDHILRLENGNSVLAPSGKPCSLSYRVLEYDSIEDCSLVEVTLHSGRHHQIRVQFSSRGHSLLGDQRYGVDEKMQIHLFSYSLSFVHPTTKERLEFQTFPPKKDYWTRFTV